MEKVVEERMDDEQAVRRRSCSLEQRFLTQWLWRRIGIMRRIFCLFLMKRVLEIDLAWE